MQPPVFPDLRRAGGRSCRAAVPSPSRPAHVRPVQKQVSLFAMGLLYSLFELARRSTSGWTCTWRPARTSCFEVSSRGARVGTSSAWSRATATGRRTKPAYAPNKPPKTCARRQARPRCGTSAASNALRAKIPYNPKIHRQGRPIKQWIKRLWPWPDLQLRFELKLLLSR